MRLNARSVIALSSVALLAATACSDNSSTGPKNSAPKNVSAAATSGNTVHVSWDAVSGATSYIVQRAAGSEAFAEVATPTTPSFDDAGLQPSTTYRYRVATVKGTDTSTFGAEVSAITKAPGSASTVVVSGNITSDRTFTADTLYVLTGYVKVKSGATLHVLAGTKVVGDTLVDGSSLWITRGGKIDARGTRENPIVFTSARSAGRRAPGDWGGIIMVGNAIVNRSQTGGVNPVTEGPQGTGQNTGEAYGNGTNADDNSGTIRYARIEFAGFAVLPDQELNSLSMYAVGRGTTLEYIQAMSGLDDSFEWFGGSVDGRYLVSYESGDDHFDWTEGYNGRNQFLIALQTYRPTPRSGAGFPSVDPRGFEGDGCENDKPGCASYAVTKPFSEPVFANFTLIGTGPGVFTFSGFKDANGAVLRRGTGGTFVNGVIARWQGIGWNVRDNATDSLRLADSLFVSNVIFADNANGNFDPAAACTSSGSGGSCGTKANYPNTQDLTGVFAAMFPGVPAAGTLPTTTALDFTPAAGSAAASGGLTVFPTRVQARVANFFGGTLAGTGYAGAVAPGGEKWWQGWTNYARN